MRANKSSTAIVSILWVLALCFAVSSCAQRQALHYKQLKYPKLGDIEIPEVKQVTLANGMQLFLLEDHELPTRSVWPPSPGP